MFALPGNPCTSNRTLRGATQGPSRCCSPKAPACPPGKRWVAAAQVILQEGVGLPDVQPAIEAIIGQELAGVHEFGERLARGELPVC